MWKTTQMYVKGKKHHQRFIDLLIEEMLGYDQSTPALGVEHRLERHRQRRHCVYSARAKGGCAQGGKEGRPPLGPISGNTRAKSCVREVRTGCKCCDVNLCIDRPCFARYHALITSK